MCCCHITVDPETRAAENGICFKAANVPNIIILFHNGSMMKEVLC